VLNEKATHTNFIAFGLTRPGLEPTIRSTPLETSVLTITPLETSVLTITPLETSVLTITPLETSVLTITPLETSVLTITPPMRFKCTNTFFVDKFSAMLYGQCNRYEKFIYNNKLQVFPEEKKVGIYQRG
jgi:ethanolamine utilization microcompartment shell protein EutS